MRTYERNLLVVLLLLSALLSISLLTRGHVWWDDFASYIMQAQSLLNGSPRGFLELNAFTIRNSSFPPGPVAYPWGFPALLAPVLAVFGLKVLALKLVNTFFYVFFLAAFHSLARLRFSPARSLVLTAILAFNPVLLHAHDLILSDIPFLAFSTLAVFLIEAGDHRRSLRAALLTGAVIFAATSIRVNGALLLIPLLVSQFLRSPADPGRPRPVLLALPYIAFAALLGLLYLILPDGQQSYLSHYALLTPSRLMMNLSYYLRLPGELFRSLPLGPVFLILIALLFFTGMVLGFRRNLVVLSYIAAVLGLFFTWPETQGARFLYPVLPLILLVAADGSILLPERLSGRPGRLAPWIELLAAGALILLSLAVSIRDSWANLEGGRFINGPFDTVSAQMFEWIRQDTPTDSVVVFFKPRLMRLLTGRDSFLTENCVDLAKADYVVIHEKQGSNGQLGDVEIACPGLNLPVVFNNKRFSVYQVPH